MRLHEDLCACTLATLRLALHNEHIPICTPSHSRSHTYSPDIVSYLFISYRDENKPENWHDSMRRARARNIGPDRARISAAAERIPPLLTFITFKPHFPRIREPINHAIFFPVACNYEPLRTFHARAFLSSVNTSVTRPSTFLT